MLKRGEGKNLNICFTILFEGAKVINFKQVLGLCAIRLPNFPEVEVWLGGMHLYQSPNRIISISDGNFHAVLDDFDVGGLDNKVQFAATLINHGGDAVFCERIHKQN